ncbi:hypothetical protein BCR34DRAFT_608401 [Clohesyomyces aquaticus]|uniref:Tat pathway signal sequence n=1 Tax=Clohesyomyces aquaticus TaxID=1231657 RepID=A0A1Y1Y8S9_9PLEO|nr:hypothetical protein BCR34DRAFT_608401 [Clohesyomyces aquaticus]
MSSIKPKPHESSPHIHSPRSSEDLLSNSATEVDEALLGLSEKAWLHNHDESHHHHLPKRRSWTATAKKYFDSAILLAIFGLLVVFLFLKHEPSRRNVQAGPQVGGDYQNMEPTFRTHTVKWNSDPSFVPHNVSDFFSDATLGQWKSIMPSNAGRAPPGETFSTTSMTHQLHCIYMLARTYSATLLSSPSLLPPDPDRHFFHCIDYLRQAVMCAADLAIEVHGENDDDDLGAGDGGWSGRHVCKVYGEVRGWLEGQIEEGRRIVLPVDD